MPIYLAVTTRLLEARGIDVRGATSDPGHLFAMIDEEAPDLLIVGLDGGPPATEVIGLVREATSRSPRLKVIALAKHADDDRVDEVFAAGASAYVTNNASPEDMETAIRQSFRHSVYLADGRQLPHGERGVDEVGLTEREAEVLRLVVEGHSNADVARMLWVTPQTVKFHLANIYRKLNVSNRTQASRWAQLVGLGTERRGQDAALAGIP